MTLKPWVFHATVSGKIWADCEDQAKRIIINALDTLGSTLEIVDIHDASHDQEPDDNPHN